MNVISITERRRGDVAGDARRWQIMADRAERLLGDLEAAAAGGPDLAALAAEAAGLRAALAIAAEDRVSMAAVAIAAYELGAAGPMPRHRAPAPPAASRERLRLVAPESGE